ncbi:histone-lysine N-methyltransferase SETMAR-like [Belonocnema kinseyi]|uniref:histone-lysine N-methyltransferase SETMAR-like n=1 Tax=Belonocnema kinseyi TaxID=2817044 RepID=UPI00143D8CA3|nr:histone-lysine N-methyltransferase SETMAR-like [Belonocnema kinseyi]
MVVEDNRLKISKIAEATRISNEQVRNILHEHLGMEKNCAKWVLRLLTVDDNAPPHRSFVVMAKISELKLELSSHPPYSADFAPSEYHMFFHLKKWLGGKNFQSNEEIIDAVNAYFEGLDESFYKNGITELEHRYEKCISLEGDYAEK